MRTTFGVLMLILISLPIMLSAKDRDTGTWLDLTVSKKVGKTIIGCTGEFYTRSDNSSIDRTSIGLKAEYPLLPWLNGCLGYTLMNYKKPGYLELRDRFYGHLESFVHYKGFIFSLRERFHLTLYPETRTATKTNYYWRNRLEVVYNPNHCKWEPVANIETWYHLRKDDNNLSDEIRVSGGTNYHLSTNQKLRLYLLYISATSINKLIAGLSLDIRI